MTRLKYNELYDFAVLIRNHKNIVSNYVNSNLLHYIECNKFSFLKEMRELYKGCIPSSFDVQLYTEVFTCYQNKFDAIQRKLKFEVASFKGFELYKKSTKRYKKGDIKTVINEKKQTPLTSCLTYLARYGNEKILDYINKQLQTCDNKKKQFYLNVINHCNKFGFNRLYKLALSKRQRIINNYSEIPIEFKSLTFSGRCRKKKIIEYNNKFRSKINSFISLSGLGRKSFDIPIKFNKNWHGKMSDYCKKSPDCEYTLTFDECKHQVNIHLSKDGNRYIPKAGSITYNVTYWHLRQHCAFIVLQLDFSRSCFILSNSSNISNLNSTFKAIITFHYCFTINVHTYNIFRASIIGQICT